MSIGRNSLWKPEHFNWVQKRILTPNKAELVARQVLVPNTETPSYAHTYEVENIDGNGKAQVIESGSQSRDIPFVGESGGSESGILVKIRDAVRITDDDIEAAAARAAKGEGEQFEIKTKRVDIGRRFIAEEENKMSFHGLIRAGKVIKPGLFNWPGVIHLTTDKNGTGSGDEKGFFDNKTPAQILKEFLKAKSYLESGGKHKAGACLISDADYISLLKPLNDQSTVSVLQWLLEKPELMFPGGFVRTQDLAAEHSGFFGETETNLKVGGFCLFDNRADVVDMIIARDLQVVEDNYSPFDGEVRIKLEEKIGGVHVYRPKGIVIVSGSCGVLAA